MTCSQWSNLLLMMTQRLLSWLRMIRKMKISEKMRRSPDWCLLSWSQHLNIVMVFGNLWNSFSTLFYTGMRDVKCTHYITCVAGTSFHLEVWVVVTIKFKPLSHVFWTQFISWWWSYVTRSSISTCSSVIDINIVIIYLPMSIMEEILVDIRMFIDRSRNLW